jgi:hypothetical protein
MPGVFCVIRAEELKKKQLGQSSSAEGWQLSRALQGRLRRDVAIVELTVDKSSVARYSPDSNEVRTEAE